MHCYFLYSFWRIIYVKLTFYLFYFRVISIFTSRIYVVEIRKNRRSKIICMQSLVCLYVVLISYYNFSFLQLIFVKSLWVESIYQCRSAIAGCPMGVAETKRLILPSMTSERILRLTVVRLRDRSFIPAVTSKSFHVKMNNLTTEEKVYLIESFFFKGKGFSSVYR